VEIFNKNFFAEKLRMKFALLIVSILFLNLAQSKFSGDATVYTDAVSSSNGFSGYACGFLYAPIKARSLFAAINAPQYEVANNCGKCASVTCVDPRCKTQNPVTVMLVDKCPECKLGDLDFSMPAWEEITGYPPDRMKIEWDFVNCDDLVDNSPPNLSIDPGANLWWVSVQISNHRSGIKSLRIKSSGADWKLTHRSENNFFIANFNQLQTPFTVEVTEENSNKYTASFSKFQCGMSFPFPAQIIVRNKYINIYIKYIYFIKINALKLAPITQAI
jgi:expansin (peptidoglycan-binding protein)